MLISSRKSLLSFAAGFASCLACVLALAAAAYFLWVKPSQIRFQQQQTARLTLPPPRFFSPHPAEFGFAAAGADGKLLDFKAERGHVIILNVWATWCGPCMVELPSL